MYEVGLMTVIALALVAVKLDLRKFLGYEFLTDFSASALLLWLLSGTFSGVVAAAFGGLIISVAVYVLRRSLGYKRLVLQFRKWKRIPYPVIFWRDFPAEWR